MDDDYEPSADRIASAECRWLAVIDYGLAMRPEDRPQTVAEWRAELAGTAAFRTTSAYRATASDRARLSSSTGPPETAELAVSTGAKPTRDSLDTPSRLFRCLLAAAPLGALLLFGVVLGCAVDEVPSRNGASAGDSGNSSPGPPTDDEESDAEDLYTSGLIEESRGWIEEATDGGYSAAVTLYRKAADQGHAAAQYSLGNMYYEGNGIPQDYAEAATWFSKAANQGHPAAQYSLGNAYREGEGVPQDYAEAATWLIEAADQGHAAAQISLGNMYYEGEGLPQNHWLAQYRYHQAATGHPEAQYKLGYMNANGLGLSEDDREAVAWYRKAADQGHVEAQLDLGRMYFHGDGVLQDYVQAYAWWNIAAAEGHEDARENRAIAAKKMTAEQIAEAQRLSRRLVSP